MHLKGDGAVDPAAPAIYLNIEKCSGACLFFCGPGSSSDHDPHIFYFKKSRFLWFYNIFMLFENISNNQNVLLGKYRYLS
jgi:hypothetical protein